ncbi:acylphosphatase [Luteimonas kalidii]|uniref:Acylphosphatase n=1 Tax=Luteimonas kalidii TaxID=3042025 RepID=A0ABT6JSR9_9GAMM|nr:acylphosphatase [Luteimonas kalidii]MDH5833176.1 acylphosphatase [Luteimonas kalidii]
MAAARFRVEGRVQGVGFRAATRAQALVLGLRGYARNLADGGVEIVAEGGPDALDALARWLEDGPPTAQVERVGRFVHAENDPGPGFDIR